VTGLGRVLVEYDTRFGATRDIAEEIGRSIRGVGLGADVAAVSSGPDLVGYSAVVLGAPVFGGKLSTGLCTWAEEHACELMLVPTAVFVVGGTLRRNTPEVRATLDEALRSGVCGFPEIGASAPRGYFAGRIDADKLQGRELFHLKLAKMPYGDWVDLDEVHKWAIRIASKLVARVSY
jgi:menaquinone-dependent protoporphyrinogen oxidase